MENVTLSMKLVAVVMGQEPADIVIQNGIWACVQSGEFIPNIDVAILGQHVAYVGEDASFAIGNLTNVIDAKGRYLVPGFLDAHLHVESSMLTIHEFVRAILPFGTTGFFADPHEIANVFGLNGIRLMVDEAKDQPIHIWIQVPSCVPSAPGFETPGAHLYPSEISEALGWPGIIGLGEVMNFPGIIQGNNALHEEINSAQKAKKKISGHYASTDLGRSFHAYVAAGPQDDHEGTRVEDAIHRVRQGMKVMLRYGSAWHDVAQGVRAITQENIDPRHFLLCTDDCHCGTILLEGHMNRAIVQAIKNGIPPITALQMATINTAEHFGVADEVGMIAAGRFADILLVSDLENITVDTVIAKGKLVVDKRELLLRPSPYKYPDWVTHSVHIPHSIKPADFKIEIGQSNITANVIGIIENQAPTLHLTIPILSKNGEVTADIDRDLVKVAVIDRHLNSGKIQLGLVNGFGLTESCAIATTVAHDAHQLIVIGTNDEYMASAVNILRQKGGGQVVIINGEIVGIVDLPIAGLMSSSNASFVANQAISVVKGFYQCGCKLNNPNMQLSLLALVVIPELRISDYGIVDVKNMKLIPLINE